MASLDRQTEQIIGIVFLAFMVIFLAWGIMTWDGVPTVPILIAAFVFLIVGIFLLGGEGRTGSPGAGSSQQQSVVLGGGRVITQGGGHIMDLCGACNHRLPPSSKFCPECGNATGGA